MSYPRGSSAKVARTKIGSATAKPTTQPIAARRRAPGRSAAEGATEHAGRKSAVAAPAGQPVLGPGTAAILAIGDEVLRGEVANANAAFLSDRLFDAGYDVRAHRVVSDDPAEIRAALAQLASEAAVILATGGLGPTDDDRTVDAVCDLVGTSPVEHQPSLLSMKQRFSAHGFEMTPNNLRQVRVPEGAQAFANPAGIAPGFALRIGAAEGYFMPGIPREMESIFIAECMPRLVKRMEERGVPRAAVRTFHVYGMGESHIDHRLVGLVDGIAGATVHFRTAAPENHVKIVVRTAEAGRSRSLLEELDHELRKRIGQGIYGTDGETFPMVVGRALREAGATLAFAESCTGGYAGQLITSEPGASAFFLGGITAYADEVKVKLLGVPPDLLAEHGAVSEPCARAMAEGLRKVSGATLAVAITGVAGSKMDGRPGLPAGGQEKVGDKPAGTVAFAVAGPRPTKSITKLFPGDRQRVRKTAAYFALNLARRYFA